MYFLRKPRFLPPAAESCTYRIAHEATDENEVVHYDIHVVNFQVFEDKAVIHDNWGNWEAGNREEARDHARMLLRLGYHLVREPASVAA